MMEPITEQDILDVEKKLSLKFDDGSKEFIKCSVTKDIQACPGAGKTTSLVAKLDIISNQMPFPGNSGVLVLTHTNVAVDEIRSKLGYNASKLMGYPNHIGTFQSFVNKYLAIPMYVNIFKKRPEKIDSEFFNEKLKAKMNSNFIGKFILDRSEDNNYTSVEKFLDALSIYDDKISLQQPGRNKTIISNRSKIFSSVKTYLEKDVVNQVISDGCISFSHCYELAEHYLGEYPEMADVISSRFKYVFVDEAQDTDRRQFDILGKIFDDSESIIQRVGDNDQSIFNFSSTDNLTWDVSQDYITINNTKRLSSKVSKVASYFSITNHNIISENDIDIAPVIIVFDDCDINKVIAKFGELIKDNELHLLDKAVFKAVGNSAKKHDTHHRIPDYVEGYLKADADFIGGNDFKDKLNTSINNISPRHIKSHFWSLIVEYLTESGIKNDDKNFTSRSLINHLKVNNEELLDQLLTNCLDIFEVSNVGGELNPYLGTSLKALSEFIAFEYNEDLLLTVISNYKLDKDKQRKNIVSLEYEDETLDISISTVHMAKGETHTATLILETYNRGYDLYQLLPLLKGKKKKIFPAKKKVIYVGMTRPTHLLCIALHRKHINSRGTECTVSTQDLEQIKQNGYSVVDLSSV
jgi:DNA helicase-2/ATP-dependent DNA helicase PcrA